MSEYRVASRYAKSVLDLAQEKGILEEVHNDLVSFSKQCELSHDLVLMLKNPIVPEDKKRKVLHAIFEGRMQKLTITFFDIILRKKREMLLPDIAKEFHNQYNLYKNIQEASISTTFALTDDLRSTFKKLAGEISGKQIELHEKVDPSLIGGFVLKIGDRQLNESIQAKLNELELSLK